METVHLPGEEPKEAKAVAGQLSVEHAVEQPPAEVEWGKPMTVPYTSEHGIAIVNL